MKEKKKKEVIVTQITTAIPKKSMPTLGYIEGKDESVYVNRMSTGRYCIYRRSVVPKNAGYKTYDTFMGMRKISR